MERIRKHWAWVFTMGLCVSCAYQPLDRPRKTTPLPANQTPRTNPESESALTKDSGSAVRLKPAPRPASPPELTITAPLIPANTNPSAADNSALSRELMDADREFARLCQEKGIAAAFFEFLDVDAICLPAGETPIHGRDAIRVKMAAKGLERVLTWNPSSAQVGAGRDLGYTWGTYELRGENGEGSPRVSYGKYVSIWKKEPDGSWKVSLQASSSSPAPLPRR